MRHRRRDTSRTPRRGDQRSAGDGPADFGLDELDHAPQPSTSDRVTTDAGAGTSGEHRRRSRRRAAGDRRRRQPREVRLHDHRRDSRDRTLALLVSGVLLALVLTLSLVGQRCGGTSGIAESAVGMR